MAMHKLCNHPGCDSYTVDANSTRCEEHIDEFKRSKAIAKNAHPRSAIYNTAQWRRTARMVKRLADYTCEICNWYSEDGRNLVADHYPLPVMECEDPYDLDNLRCICLRCSGTVDGGRRYPTP